MTEFQIQDTVRRFKIEILTPVHIGSTKEDQLKEGIDYFYNRSERKNYLVLWNKIINEPELMEKMKLLLLGGITKDEDVGKFYDDYPEYFEPVEAFLRGDINMHIKNSITKNLIIPGSSVKGAIRSVLLHYFLEKEPAKRDTYRDKVKKKKLKKDTPLMDDIFGKLKNGHNIMRFIHIADTEFQDSAFINSKIFSLKNEEEGGWKHKRTNGTEKNFSPFGFVSTYEVISMGKIESVMFKIEAKKFKEVSNALQFNALQTHFFTSQSEIFQNMFHILNEYIIQFAKKEIAYYRNYRNGVDYVRYLTAKWHQIRDWAQEAIDKGNKYAILQVGMGSGFHGVTGDWLHATHLVEELGYRKKPSFTNGIKTAKTRKWAFERNNQGKFDFYPFGFVKIGAF